MLDGVVDDAQRAALLSCLLGPDPPLTTPPPARWERTTCDGAGLPPSWGLQPQRLRSLEISPPPAVVEVSDCPFRPSLPASPMLRNRAHYLQRRETFCEAAILLLL